MRSRTDAELNVRANRLAQNLTGSDEVEEVRKVGIAQSADRIWSWPLPVLKPSAESCAAHPEYPAGSLEY